MVKNVMSTSNKKNRYKKENGKHWIEVRVKHHLQLFDVRDPAPFRERDLDDDFVEYIMASAREFSISTPLKIVLHIEERETEKVGKELIRGAIYSYMSYRLDLQKSELKKFIKRIPMYLTIGLVLLGTCLGVSQNLPVSDTPGLMSILREGLVIFGWVSIWKPIELVLFDWYPIFEELRFSKKLLETEIDVQFIAPAESLALLSGV